MAELKRIIAANLSALRQKAQLTQAELGEKINYTDKSVSKWERGDAAPDIVVLKQLADLFGVSVDHLLTEHPGEEQLPEPAPKPREGMGRNQMIITAIAVLGAVLLAITAFIAVLLATGRAVWQIFAVLVPTLAILMIVLNSVWGKPARTAWYISALVWSGLAAACILFSPQRMWPIMACGVPAQGVILLAFRIKKAK